MARIGLFREWKAKNEYGIDMVLVIQVNAARDACCFIGDLEGTWREMERALKCLRWRIFLHEVGTWSAPVTDFSHIARTL